MYSMKNYKVLIYLFAFILGLILASRCKKEIVKIEKVTVEKRYVDTIEIIKEVIHTEYFPTEVVSEIITDSCKYYVLSFKKDSMYNLMTYGGYIDSINLKIFEKEIRIKDSIVITNTINTLHEVNTHHKNTIAVEYLYNSNNNVILDYTRNFNRLSIGGKVGINMDSKTPIIGGKIGISF